MTNPRGWSFLSYRRSRIREAALLVAAQNELGVPTWQDVENLDAGHTETEIVAVLNDPNTANAVLWLTPDVKDSHVIQRVELPKIQQRARRKDGFFVVGVAAGGLERAEVSAVVDSSLVVHGWGEWNLQKVDVDPIGESEAQRIAERVLDHRLKTLHEALPPQAPLSLSLHTKDRPPRPPGADVVVDWSIRFSAGSVPPEVWGRYLQPSLQTLAEKIGREAPGRMISASGHPSICAATALGYAFMAPKGIKVLWNQESPNGSGTAPWSLDHEVKPSRFFVESLGQDPSASALAVLVSVAADVDGAFASSKSSLPQFRAVLSGKTPSLGVIGAGEAVDIARKTSDAIRQARSEFKGARDVHLFMAVPVGLALMIGQLLNSVGPVQTYEHIPSDLHGRYVPAARLRRRDLLTQGWDEPQVSG